MHKDDFEAIFMIGIIAAFLIFTGWAAGYNKGMDAYAERIKERDCKWKYQSKPVNEVSAECYKYFDIKK